MPIVTNAYPISLRARTLQAKRVVVKIGSTVLTDASGRFDSAHFAALCQEIASAAKNHEIIVVSSGAIALGIETLELESRPTDLPAKQATAAVGQCRLMRLYGDELGRNGFIVGQLLLTHEDVADRRRYLNARQTLGALLAQRVIPIINENDTVSVDEIQIGDNDALAGLVVGLCDADMLVLLSDVEGLFDRDPRDDPKAQRIPVVMELTPEIEGLAGISRSGLGTGGMATKVRAAKRATETGALTVIASGRVKGTLTAVLRGEDAGTVFGAPRPPLRARQRWIAHALRTKGTLIVDAGAREALVRRGSSLLPSGIQRVVGDFERGAAVEIADQSGKPFARGLVGYDSQDLSKLCGVLSSEIESLLGYRYLDEVIHRDDLVLHGEEP